MNYQFPTDTCIVACSGPSLNKVDVFSLGLPVCVISTAIRTIKNPDYWFIADHLNEMHGQEGKEAWTDSNITKIVPNKTTRTTGVNVIQHPYRETKEGNHLFESILFDPTQPLLRGPHKTLTFAIQWLHVSGVKNIIFAGNDLQAQNFESKYSYQIQNFDKKKQHNFKKTLDQIKNTLSIWYPIAKTKGFQWYSWECGEVFESMVPKYNPDILNNVQYYEKKVETVEYIKTKNKEIQKQKVVDLKEKKKLKEFERSRLEYKKLLKKSEDKRQDRKPDQNMKIYFDLLHKRKK